MANDVTWKDFKFTSFKTDQLSYRRPVDSTTIAINFKGDVQNNGYQPIVFVEITRPDGTTYPLTGVPLLRNGHFQTSDSVDKHSKPGSYTAQAHCKNNQNNMDVYSDKIKYKVI